MTHFINKGVPGAKRIPRMKLDQPDSPFAALCEMRGQRLRDPRLARSRRPSQYDLWTAGLNRIQDILQVFFRPQRALD